jgi:hypothetical protein
MAADILDVVLIFGVIPVPMLPMERLLSEMQRILKPGGMRSASYTKGGSYDITGIIAVKNN